MTVEPRAPEFSQLDSGAYKLSKQDLLLLQQQACVSMIGARSRFSRCWWWRLVLSLALVLETRVNSSMTPLKEQDYFENSAISNSEAKILLRLSSDEGKIRKILKIEPLPDGSGHFFNLSIPLTLHWNRNEIVSRTSC